MYIISKKKDYYDGVVGTMGIDKEIVYERKEKIIEDSKQFPKEFAKPNDIRDFFRKTNHFSNLKFYSPKEKSKYEQLHFIILVFCCKLYTIFKLNKKRKKRLPNKIWDASFTTNFIYDSDKIKEHLEIQHWGRNLNDDINYIENYDALHIFREYKTPVFIYDSNYNRINLRDYKTDDKFIINPLLKKYEFYKVFDSFTAFQEIQMFISGVLEINKKETVEISDKDKIEQHGYDKKWSFRKEPTKKKKR